MDTLQFQHVYGHYEHDVSAAKNPIKLSLNEMNNHENQSHETSVVTRDLDHLD